MRHFLTRDNDAHWYVVPVERSEEWEDWLALDSDDQRSWEPPVWAHVVGGSPSMVSFTDWRLDACVMKIGQSTPTAKTRRLAK